MLRLSDSAAESLSKHQGRLELKALKGISDAAAKSLAQHRGPVDLAGLLAEEVSQAAAESLSQNEEIELYGDLAKRVRYIKRRLK
ncbi:MAG: hypothetical protein FGM15_03370 [Chthoniobacterales bacterium]|nr:hypothetical protein [Chthoniobacterales bacterium]